MELKLYLRQKLSAESFDKLHGVIGITRARFTRMINRPRNIRVNEFISLCEFLALELNLNSQIIMLDLLKNYNCGWDGITLSEAEHITGYNIKIEISNT